MAEYIAYHGTNRTRGEEMLQKERMELSEGDHHWLGDGSYFYKQDFWAYKWIREMYKNRYGNNITAKKITQRYMIIHGIILVEEDRVFDLGDLETKGFFDETYKMLKNKKNKSNRFKNVKLIEGVVINYLFNERNFYEHFDLVRAVFTRNHNTYVGVNGSTP